MISELAALAGVKVSTVRYYEREGLLEEPLRTSGGYRCYDAEDLHRVRFLRRGQELGFTLRELAQITELSSGTRLGEVPAAEVARRGAAKLAELDARIADLQRVRTALDSLLSPGGFDPAAPCPVVAALAAEGDTSGPRRGGRGADDQLGDEPHRRRAAAVQQVEQRRHRRPADLDES